MRDHFERLPHTRFRDCSFSIQRTRPSRSLEQASQAIKITTLGPVPKRLIRANLGLKFRSLFLYLPSFALLIVTFYVVITVSQNKGSRVFWKFELHVLRQENPA